MHPTGEAGGCEGGILPGVDLSGGLSRRVVALLLVTHQEHRSAAAPGGRPDAELWLAGVGAVWALDRAAWPAVGARLTLGLEQRRFAESFLKPRNQCQELAGHVEKMCRGCDGKL